MGDIIGREAWQAAECRRWNNTWGEPEQPAARITIELEAFGYGFDVRVLPPPQGVGHDREFREITDARAYAATLSRATGWPVVDQVEANRI